MSTSSSPSSEALKEWQTLPICEQCHSASVYLCANRTVAENRYVRIRNKHPDRKPQVLFSEVFNCWVVLALSH
jgi:hypothetical protein